MQPPLLHFPSVHPRTIRRTGKVSHWGNLNPPLTLERVHWSQHPSSFLFTIPTSPPFPSREEAMRRNPCLTYVCLVVLALWEGSAFGEANSPAASAGPSDVKTLIAQLGDAKFAARKSAGEKLAKIGLPAYQALEEATRDGDREIRYRAEKILSIIRQNDLNRRLTIFLASLDSPEDRTLPAWPRFKAAHGNTAVSRSLFVEMQRVEGELLAQLEVDPRKATDLLSKRAVALADDLNRL